MASNKEKPAPERQRRGALIALGVSIFLLFGIVASQQAFNLTFLRPNGNEQTLLFASLSWLIFLLLVALIFVLFRTLLKLSAERRTGVLGSRFRTRMARGALLLSLSPVLVMFFFSYGLMNRSIERWFSSPVEEVSQSITSVASLLTSYALNDAEAEAASIAATPETQHSFATGNFSGVLNEFRRHQTTIGGGFAMAVVGDTAEASFHAPDLWPVLRSQLPSEYYKPSARQNGIRISGREYVLGVAPVGERGRILVAMPLPGNFTRTLSQIKQNQARYLALNQERKLLRNTYMGLLGLLTVLVLFASTWLGLFLAKTVTRPVVALAQATQEISRGHFDYRVEIAAPDELGQLVKSFNSMAGELEANRRQLEQSSRSIAEANAAVEQRRRHMEIILESSPTGMLSLDAQGRITHTNSALRRMFRDQTGDGSLTKFAVGTALTECFPPDVADDLTRLRRKSDRMGTVATQMEIGVEGSNLDIAVTVASIQVDRHRLGYVIVFEDLSDLIKAQKQAAWREVARRVAHEIKNPLTPIALSAERIRRHLERGTPPDEQSLAIMHGCAETIAGAVETVRTLVNEFSTLARFPAAQPHPSDINSIVESALALFDGRLDGISVRTSLAQDLPKIMADGEAIKRAVANLVDNAAEAMQDSMLREVEISTTLLAARDMVEIVVADSGHGVTREVKEKLFLPYFSTKRRGTGLGLAIVSRIVEDHHGSIRVEENSPMGTRFIVELPVAPESASTATSNA